ncbi:hypothetical protein [Phreatobacter stygius]|uniref:Uncharacterized protein n=1 Tax=Phreatobacter stygius TaxID=1940610 RepID=A0A4D7BBB2_9HYPH|nr:hypothetical protein [Phreatobacter stygius]QCI67398.1 hypothetical protein E8M01_26135 [Phreatobacter stygius]
MTLVRAALASTKVRILAGLLVLWLVWQAWLAIAAPAKIAEGFPERLRVNALITLPFPPERFHILVFQRHGRVSGTEGNTVELRGIAKSDLTAIARLYWVRRIAPLREGAS